jgi:hypothetical protein
MLTRRLPQLTDYCSPWIELPARSILLKVFKRFMFCYAIVVWLDSIQEIWAALIPFKVEKQVSTAVFRKSCMNAISRWSSRIAA